MAVQKNALFPVGRQVGFQPGSLLLFCGEARIDDLGVDDDEVAAVTVEGLILGAEVFVPERQVVLMDAGCRGPVVGFVADVVVARRQVERVFQFFDLLMKSRRRCSVQVGDGSYVRKLVTELSGGVFGYLDSVLERHSFDEFGELI